MVKRIIKDAGIERVFIIASNFAQVSLLHALNATIDKIRRNAVRSA